MGGRRGRGRGQRNMAASLRVPFRWQFLLTRPLFHLNNPTLLSRARARARARTRPSRHPKLTKLQVVNERTMITSPSEKRKFGQRGKIGVSEHKRVTGAPSEGTRDPQNRDTLINQNASSQSPPISHLPRQSNMARIASKQSTSFVALICITALLFRSSAAFTLPLSMAPLLTSWGRTPSKITNRVTEKEMGSKITNMVTGKEMPKQAPSSFQFTRNDVRLISDCKSNTIEYIFAKSLDRGFD